ncbi:albusnodin/ikarugamycin family macrolactam cyclase [Nocardiopsis sp. NPDC006938]|uniref:albusnodin/ikarugamycin family macrolactam cyclase n=1 Tax=Nocardiopsis sp. NPDC006938 TaxID=3364337 RepID=UPI00368B20F1
MFGGITTPVHQRTPCGSRPVAGVSSAWMTSEEELPMVVATATGYLVVMGLCNATSEEVARTVKSAVPDDVAWRWSGAYIVAHVEGEHVTLWTNLGALPVYVHRENGVLYWSTSARALASLGSSMELDRKAVEEFIGGFPITHSLFSGIERLPAGHRIRLGDGVVSATQVWSPRRSPVPAPLRLRQALQEAVTTRVDRFSTPTCDFSGGLDSTTLGLLAARRLAPQARSITATTLHPVRTTTGGDMDYVGDAIRTPGLTHAWIGRDHTHAPYGDLRLVPTDEPPVSTVSLPSFRDHMHWLSAHGSTVHMTGDGGDALLLTPAVYFREMIGKHPFRTTGAASRFAQARRMSLRQAFAHGHTSSPARTGLDLPSRTHHTMLATLIDSARSARADVELAATCGVRLDNPFFDARVIDAYLSMDVREMPEPARYKPVLKEAMADLLPPALLRRTTKATTSADHFEGLRRALPQVSALVDGHLATVGLIDAQAVQSRLGALAVGAGDLGPIERIVAFEAWWNALRPIPWKESAHAHT